MKKSNQKILRAAALSTVAATMAAVSLPVNAETENDGVTKKEDVFIVLNTDGTVNQTTVSDTLHSDTGFSNYDDASNLTDAQNLKSTDPLTKSSDGYTWNTSDKDIYYQGTYNGDLPLGVSISYTLDGKSVKEEDLLGQSGHIKITMDLTNKKYQYYEVNGKSYKIALPIVAVTGAMLNKDVFSNVTVNTGNVTSDSSHDIVASVAMPGMKDSLENIVAADSLDAIDEYLNDEIVIEADAENYEAPEIMLAASTDTADLKNELSGTDLSSVWSSLDKLQSATNELMSGAQALYDGTTQLSDGATQLSDGAQKLVDGANTLTDGADQVSAGASSLETGLGTLSANSSTLNAGAKQIEDSVFATATQQINDDETVKASKKTYSLNASNYASVLAEVLQINDAERQQAFDQIKAAAEKTSGGSLEKGTVYALIYMASIHNTGSDITADIKTQGDRLAAAQKVQGYASAYTTKDSAMKNSTVAALLSAIVSYKTSSSYTLSDTEYAAAKVQLIATARAGAKGFFDQYTDDEVMAYLLANQYKGFTENAVITKAFKDSLTSSNVYDAIAAQLKASAPSLTDAGVATAVAYTAENYGKLDNTSFAATSAAVADAAAVSGEMAAAVTATGQQKIISTLNVIVANSSSYQTNSQKLKDLQTSLDGLVSFVEGLKTYTAGVDTAYAGSQSLATGAAAVAAGASTLSDGASQLKTGIDSLSAGINTVKDGAQTLLNGMKQYNDEGISKITSSTEVADLKNADAILKQMKETGEDYTNYSGISEGTTGTVKFVYKVKTIKTEKDTSTASTTDDVTHVDDGSNFWSRLISLFVFWK